MNICMIGAGHVGLVSAIDLNQLKGKMRGDVLIGLRNINLPT
jgi:UDP-glucose 6-dehydrogenase